MAILFLKEISLILFGILIGIFSLGALFIFKKALFNKKETNKNDIYTISIAQMFLFSAIGCFLRVCFMFFIAQNNAEFMMQITATERSAEALPAYADDGRLELLQLLWRLHIAFTSIGIIFLMFATEYKIYKKTKYVLTIFTIAIVPLVLFLPYEIAHLLYLVSFLIPLLIVVIYIIMAKNTTGSIRRNAIMFLLGFLLFLGGVLLNSGTVRGMFFGTADLHLPDSSAIFSCWFSPIFLIIGSSFMILAFLNKF